MFPVDHPCLGESGSSSRAERFSGEVPRANECARKGHEVEQKMLEGPPSPPPLARLYFVRKEVVCDDVVVPSGC